MKYSHYQSTGSAAKMMCPFKFVQKRSIKSIIYLAVGLLVTLIDYVFSKHILINSIVNEPVFVVLLAVSGFSILKDVVSTKNAFSNSQPFVLLRLSSITASMLFTAAALYAAPLYSKYQVYIVLICSAFRLLTPSKKLFYVSLLLGTAAIIAAIIVMKAVYGGASTAEIELSRIYPVCSTLIMKVKDFIVSRW